MTTSPKQCKCGKQGFAIDSRQHEGYIRRRYRCECGEVWTTCEVRVDGVLKNNDCYNKAMRSAFDQKARDEIADKLIELAQEILHNG